ncbi:MAG: hypothetical protein AAFU53_01370 [Cyanobacteria bacterium J06632_3]
MTLSVYPYRRKANQEIEYLSVPPDYSELAGTEATRWSFWGSPQVKALGVSLLPALTHQDIYAESHQLTQLKQEIETLQQQLSNICTIPEKEYWQIRLSNILTAIQIAKEHSGGIYIG